MKGVALRRTSSDLSDLGAALGQDQALALNKKSELSDLSERCAVGSRRFKPGLRDMAARWRAESEEEIVPRHEYQSSTHSGSMQQASERVGQVGQVGSGLGLSSLDLSDPEAARSDGSDRRAVGDLTSWLHEAKSLRLDSEVAPSAAFSGFKPALAQVQLSGEERVSAWGFTPDDRHQRLARLQHRAVPDLRGVPGQWCAGVYKLQTLPAPSRIDPHRWLRYRHDALRLLHEQGAELHATGWDALDLFSLHRIAPDRRADAMGVAWLMRERTVTAITPEAVSLTTYDGVVLRARRLGRQARNEALLAWELLNPAAE